MTPTTTVKLVWFSFWWPLVWTVVGVFAGHAAVVQLIPQDARHWTAIGLCTLVPAVMLAIPIGILLNSCPDVRKPIIITTACLITVVAFFASSVLFTGMQKVQ